MMDEKDHLTTDENNISNSGKDLFLWEHYKHLPQHPWNKWHLTKRDDDNNNVYS